MRRPLAAATLALLAAAPALAADPEGGAVSTASPTVQWNGLSSGGFATTITAIFVTAAGENMPCQAPSCDTFLLEVEDQADLNVEVTSEVSITYLQVEKPDGEVIYNYGIEPEGAEPDYTTKLRIKKAPVGTYKVQAAVNSSGADEPYTGAATLSSPPPAVPPSGGQPTPPPSGQPQPQPAPAPATISAKAAGKLSARKLARTRKLPLKLTSSGRVDALRIAVGRKGKTVATGKLARLEGTRKFALRLRKKLKPGRYSLVVQGRDAGGSTIGVRTTVKVVR